MERVAAFWAIVTFRGGGAQLAALMARGGLPSHEGCHCLGGSVHQAVGEGLAVMVRESVAHAALLYFPCIHGSRGHKGVHSGSWGEAV